MVSSTLAIITLTLTLPSLALAQAQAQTPSSSQQPLPYGPAITLQQARAVSAAAMAEAAKNGWRAIVAVVDSSGQVVSLDRMDGAQFGSIDIARQRPGAPSHSSVRRKRSRTRWNPAASASASSPSMA